MTEMDLLNSIRSAVQELNCLSFRCNVGKVKMQDGRWFETGLPKGFSDLLVIRDDGMAVFIETKLHPRKPTKEQCKFLIAMIGRGNPAGVAYSIEDAIKIIKWENDFPKNMETALRGCLLYGSTK